MIVNPDIELGQEKQKPMSVLEGYCNNIKTKYNDLPDAEKQRLFCNTCAFVCLLIALGGVVWGHVERYQVVGFEGPITGLTVPDSIITNQYICDSGSKKGLCRNINIKVNYTVGEKTCSCEQTMKFKLFENNDYDELLDYLNASSRKVNIFYGLDDCNRCFPRFDSDWAHTPDLLIVFFIILYIPIGISLFLTGLGVVFGIWELFVSRHPPRLPA